MELENKLKIIKENVKKLVENKNRLIINAIDDDIDGYLYCITDSIFNIYNIEIYKIGNSSSLISRLKNFNNSYFELINVKNLVSVPYKTMFETLIFRKLKNYRIYSSREFFTNYKNINDEFIKINELVLSNSEIVALEKYYLYVMESNIILNEQISNNFNICMNKKVNYNLVKNNYGTKIKDKIKNHNCNINKGYIVHFDIPEISYNFDNCVQTILITRKKSLTFTEFLGKQTSISNIKVYDIKLAKLLFHDMLNGKHIKNKYFECSKELIKETMDKIKEYFKNYFYSDKIKNAYLYDVYNEGTQIEPDKKQRVKITDENFKLNYGSYFDKLKIKIFDDNYIDDMDNNNIDDDNIFNEKENHDELENIIKEKIKIVKKIQKKYKKKYYEKIKPLYSDSDSDSSPNEEIDKNKNSKSLNIIVKDNSLEKNENELEEGKKNLDEHFNTYVSKFKKLRMNDSDEEIIIKPKKELSIEIKNNGEMVKKLKQTYKSISDKYCDN